MIKGLKSTCTIGLAKSLYQYLESMPRELSGLGGEETCVEQNYIS
jgi:hypothetical protein